MINIVRDRIRILEFICIYFFFAPEKLDGNNSKNNNKTKKAGQLYMQPHTIIRSHFRSAST